MRPSLLSLAALLVIAPIGAQTVPLPHDPDVRTGQLDNGLRYWVRENTEPEDRLELRLIVKAGSILEDDDQRGLAHFLEHMAFNGTTRYAKNDLIKALESIGVRFGADLNAYTSFDETVYILPVPSDKPELVTLAFDVLGEWAGGVTNDSAAVVGERGVVMGEWRSGLGAGSRTRDREFPVLFRGSRYAERLPIGDTAIIAHAQPGPVRRFYRDWYRPDLMAVVAVGDVPADSLEALIRSRFAGLTNPAPSRERFEAPVPELAGVRFSAVTDDELTGESVQLLVRRPSTQSRTVADERRALVASLVSTVAGQRLEEVGRDADAPFSFAFFGPTTLVRDIGVFALSASAKDGRMAEAFEAVLLELRRLTAHGIGADELERAKADLLRGRERAAREADNTPSAALVARYTAAFLQGDVPVSAADRFALAAELLPGITLADVNAAIREMATGDDRFIGLRAPAREGVALPTQEAMVAILERTDTATVAPWEDKVVEGPLVTSVPTPGRVMQTLEHPEVGVTEWRLANGIRVLVKPTEFKADEIVMNAIRPGGSSLLSPDDEFQAGFGDAAVGVSGVGNFDPPALEKRLAGKVATASAGLGELEERFLGRTTPDDLETFFEVLWLHATAPRFDSAAVAGFLARLEPFFANRDRAPQTAFSDTVTLILGQGSPRARPIDQARFASLEPRRAYELFVERFRDFSGFTFAFVGNIDPDRLQPLVEQWIGALPADGAPSTWRDVTPPFLPDSSTTMVHKGQEPVSTTALLFNGPAAHTDIATRGTAAIASSILQTRLIETLREAMGGTYGAQASASVTGIPRAGYSASVIFTSTPEQADSMWLATRATILDLQSNGPTAEELANAVEQQRRVTQQQLESNAAWGQLLVSRVRIGEPFVTITEWESRLDAITAEAVRDVAREVFALERVARVVLMPEDG
jgi:zinc protease